MTLHPRDRTERGKTYKSVRKYNKPPADQGGWLAETRELLESPAMRSLSQNANRAWDRLKIEHVSHGQLHNGKLIVTHAQFVDFGVTPEYVADAIDELAFKGLIRFRRGRAGDGTAHPNTYRLTIAGDYEGAPATNEWRRLSEDDCKRWITEGRAAAKQRRANVGRKKTSLRKPEIRPLRKPEIRRVSETPGQAQNPIKTTGQPISGLRSAIHSMGENTGLAPIAAALPAVLDVARGRPAPQSGGEPRAAGSSR